MLPGFQAAQRLPEEGAEAGEDEGVRLDSPPAGVEGHVGQLLAAEEPLEDGRDDVGVVVKFDLKHFRGCSFRLKVLLHVSFELLLKPEPAATLLTFAEHLALHAFCQTEILKRN